MPSYLVERSIPHAGELTEEEWNAVVQQSRRVERAFQARIQWIHSVITAQGMVCLYVADSEAIVREHARRSGLPVRRIEEVSAVLGPTMNGLNEGS